jgi:hemerythrin superfamily protein
MLEEEIFYPAARARTDEDDLLDEAAVEHDGAKILVAQIEATAPGMDLYDARVRVLAEQVLHHVEEEEGALFPAVRDSGVDLAALGARMAERKAQLMALLAPPPAF